MATKKYMFFILFVFLISLMIFSKTDAMIDELPLLGRIVYVDPGHGSTLYTKRERYGLMS